MWKVNDKRRTKHDGKSSHGLWPGELKTNENVVQNGTWNPRLCVQNHVMFLPEWLPKQHAFRQSIKKQQKRWNATWNKCEDLCTELYPVCAWGMEFFIFDINQRFPAVCNRSHGRKLLSITTQLHCGGHLVGRAWLPDTILEKDHRMTIPSKFVSNWATGSRQDCFYVNFP